MANFKIFFNAFGLHFQIETRFETLNIQLMITYFEMQLLTFLSSALILYETHFLAPIIINLFRSNLLIIFANCLLEILYC